MSDTDTMFRVVNGRASKEEAESYIASLITRLAEAEKWRDRWQGAAADAEATQAEVESQLLSLTQENERAAGAARGAYDELLAQVTSERARAEEAEEARTDARMEALDLAGGMVSDMKAKLSEAEQRAARYEEALELIAHWKTQRTVKGDPEPDLADFNAGRLRYIAKEALNPNPESEGGE